MTLCVTRPGRLCILVLFWRGGEVQDVLHRWQFLPFLGCPRPSVPVIACISVMLNMHYTATYYSMDV